MTDIKEFRDILACHEIGRDELLLLLKTESKQINIQDIMQASSFLIEDARYVQGSYRKEYLQAYTLAFITRIKEVKEHQPDDNKYLDVQEVHEAISLLLKQENEVTGAGGFDPAFFQILQVLCHHLHRVYRTFLNCRFF